MAEKAAEEGLNAGLDLLGLGENSENKNIFEGLQLPKLDMPNL